MNDYTTAQKLIDEASHLIILAGAGMSADLGIATYWSGTAAKYASDVSSFGYTNLEHATEELWTRDLSSQLMFFNQTWRKMLETEVDSVDSPYRLLLDYINMNKKEYFVQTTNVDSAFIRMGFDESKICEVHGAYRFSQCLQDPRDHGVFDTTDPYKDYSKCIECGNYARPNVMFFDDLHFNSKRLNYSMDDYSDFREDNASTTVAIEIGAGPTVPTIRNQSRILNKRFDIPVIRINPEAVTGVDGLANILGKSETAPFIELFDTATDGLKKLFGN